jgi:hypothetical protein
MYTQTTTSLPYEDTVSPSEAVQLLTLMFKDINIEISDTRTSRSLYSNIGAYSHPAIVATTTTSMPTFSTSNFVDVLRFKFQCEIEVAERFRQIAWSVDSKLVRESLFSWSLKDKVGIQYREDYEVTMEVRLNIVHFNEFCEQFRELALPIKQKIEEAQFDSEVDSFLKN